MDQPKKTTSVNVLENYQQLSLGPQLSSGLDHVHLLDFYKPDELRASLRGSDDTQQIRLSFEILK